MNSVEKDNIIQKAICCSGNKAKEVADMYIKGNPCADKEFDKLFLLISYTESLGCYQAPLEITTYATTASTPVLAQFTFTIPCTTWDLTTGTFSGTVTVNGVPTSAAPGPGDSFQTVITGILTGLGMSVITAGCSGGNNIITVTSLCNTTTLSITLSVTTNPPPSTVNTEFIGTEIVEGSCLTHTLTGTTVTTEYTNCLTEDQADSLANNIALICDLCDEH